MFSKRYEQELAEIKAMTQRLGERLQGVVERVDRMIEEQEGRPPRSAPETNQGPNASEQGPVERRVGRGVGDGGSPQRKGPKAAKRARTAQAAASTTEAVKSDVEPAAEAAPAAGARKRRDTDRPRKARKARANREAGAQTSEAMVGRDETEAAKPESQASALGERGANGDAPKTGETDDTAAATPAVNDQPPANAAATQGSRED